MRSPVRITEVGPRDGLQNESGIVGVEAKVAFIDRLSEAGCPEIELTSFVSPKWVPQLADASEVLGRIRRRPGTIYSALVPNERGLERALDARVAKVAALPAAGESCATRSKNGAMPSASGSMARPFTRWKKSSRSTSNVLPLVR